MIEDAKRLAQRLRNANVLELTAMTEEAADTIDALRAEVEE